MAEPSLELYFAPTPNGWKPTILLEELEAPYKVMFVDLRTGDQFQPEFLAISPNNRMPVLVDKSFGDGRPLSIFESGAIMVYLADKYGKFLPKGGRERSDVMQWLFWQVGGLGPMAGQYSHFFNYARHVAPDKDHSYSLNRYRDEYDRCFAVMQRQLERTRYLGGSEVSIADFACWPWVAPYKFFGTDLDKYPDVRRWFDELKVRPGLRRGMEVGKVAARATLGKGAQMTSEEKELMFRQKGASSKL